eukprot:CAMPEP_0175052288 /NCGR_PEP_ID=MMETSP0052_2-20121109/8278_1 /TAXON_ID=51329 ORGANISM="Polytomella parva, Strain SAG 63-3" /NCGR_SAMPLE_ID=MMETSP0052_2 /ASSEMBLY_ACC=CAM_ASM_000194 /LENGTH=802 /DNA_ID=CAMNT_0016316679 /DNA_START=253 /DNA_END=2661 /DNA_ORIENTATION=+
MDDLEDELFMLGSGKSAVTKKRGRQKTYNDGASDAEPSQDSDDNKSKKKASKNRGGQKSRNESSSDDEDFSSEDGLFEDETDKKRLLAMSELDREVFLANRAEKRDKERLRNELLQQPNNNKSTSSRSGGVRRGKDNRGMENALKQITAARERRGAKAEAAKASNSGDESGGQESDDSYAAEDGADLSSDVNEDDDFNASSDDLDERPAARLKSNEDEDYDDREEGELRIAKGGGSTGGGAADSSQGPSLSTSSIKRMDHRSPSDSVVLRSEAYADDEHSDEDDEEDQENEGREGGRGSSRGEGRENDRSGYRDEPYNEDDEDGEEVSYEDLCTIQLTRQQLEDWMEMPFFKEKEIVGPVVRMAYGQHAAHPSASGAAAATAVSAQYMVMEIVEVVDRTSDPTQRYPFGPRGAMTGKHLRLRDGMGVERVLRMANVSSKKVEMEEYERYLRHCGKMNRRPITRAEAAVTKEKIKEMTNYRWKPDDVKEVLRRKQEAGPIVANPIAERIELHRRLAALEDVATRQAERAAARFERRRLLHLSHRSGDSFSNGFQLGPEDEEQERETARREAEAHGEDDPENVIKEVQRLRHHLQSVDEHLKAIHVKSGSLRNLNRRNREMNVQVAFKQKVQDHDGRAQGVTSNDVFSRRATKPAIYWDTKGTGAKREEGEEENAGGVDGADGQLVGVAERGKSQSGDSEDISSHNGILDSETSNSVSHLTTVEAIEKVAKLTSHQRQLSPLDLLKDIKINIDLNKMKETPVVLPMCKKVLGSYWTEPLRRQTFASAEGKIVVSVEEYLASTQA